MTAKIDQQMELKAIELNIDKSEEIYAAVECQQLIDAMMDFYPKIGFHKPWIGYFAVRDYEVVGAGGFTGKPEVGKVEIAYGTFKRFEGQGIASFICKQLITIAKTSEWNVIITAKTAPEKNASTKILENNGFSFSGIVQDEEIGDAWLWTLPSEE